MSGARVLWGQVCLVLLVALGFVWAATEWTAWRLGFQAELGEPLFRWAGWPVYAPPAFFLWWFEFDGYAPGIFLRGASIAASGGLVGAVVAMALSVARAREGRSVTTYGSARWAADRDVRRAGLLGGEGVTLGAWRGAYLRHDGPEHVLCFAPTRSGKGVGLVVPTLLTWKGSAVVHDLKGENWALTAGWRSTLGRVLLFDPTNPRSAAYNPLLEVRRGDAEVRDVQNIADILVDPEGALDRRNHWEKTSHALLVGAILHVLYVEADKTLAGVAGFLSDPRRPIEATLRAMMSTAHLGDRPHPVVAAAARELLNKSENERSGVLSTAMSFLGLYRDPVVAKVTARCDWTIADLVSGDRPVTLYLVVPPSDISRTKPLVRLLLNQIGRRLTEDLQGADRRHRLLLMLDEFPALGRLDFFETALAFMAGYGLKAFLIAQSLNQIERAYGPNNAILDNAHVRVAFATNDERTAKRVSDALGTATEQRSMKNYAGHRLSPWLGHLMVSRQETARPLLTPGEVMQLPADEELVLVSGCPPVRARKVRYFTDTRLARRVFPPPEIAPASEAPGAASGWSDLGPMAVARGAGADGGLRWEPELAPPEVASMDRASSEEFAGFDDEQDLPADGGLSDEREAFRRRSGLAARQASLDSDDGIDL
jgi:type IV secretion system protein VirD4